MASDEPLARYAFIDETFRDPGNGNKGFYQLSAALVEGSLVADFRTSVETAFGHSGPFKASKLAKENRLDVVENMLDMVAKSDLFNLVVVHNDHDLAQEAARQRCLETLLIDFKSQQILNVIIDSRESVVGPDPEVRNKKDEKTRQRLARSSLIDRNLTIRHMHDDAEALLWVPDAVGWAHRQHLLVQRSTMWERVADASRVVYLPSDRE